MKKSKDAFKGASGPVQDSIRKMTVGEAQVSKAFSPLRKRGKF
jgi:hypothetical protein